MLMRLPDGRNGATPLCPKTQTHSRPARRDVSGPTAKQHRRQVRTRALSAPGPERASPLRRGSPASILDPSGGLFSDAARPCQRPAPPFGANVALENRD